MARKTRTDVRAWPKTRTQSPTAAVAWLASTVQLSQSHPVRDTMAESLPLLGALEGRIIVAFFVGVLFTLALVWLPKALSKKKRHRKHIDDATGSAYASAIRLRDLRVHS